MYSFSGSLWKRIDEEIVARRSGPFKATPLHQLLWKTLPPEVRGELFLRDIREAWERLVEGPLGQCTAPLKIRETVLFVAAAHPPGAQEMQFQEREILKKINREFALELSRMRISVGPLPRKESPRRDPESAPGKIFYPLSREEISREEESFEVAPENQELQHSLAKLRAIYKKRFGK
jgi:hypothetical protein